MIEVDYWCRKLLAPGVFAAFIDDLAAGAYRLVDLDARGYQRAAGLTGQYLRLDLVDAAVMATCELTGETKVATPDRRHFSVVRPAHCPALALLP